MPAPCSEPGFLSDEGEPSHLIHQNELFVLLQHILFEWFRARLTEELSLMVIKGKNSSPIYIPFFCLCLPGWRIKIFFLVFHFDLIRTEHGIFCVHVLSEMLVMVGTHGWFCQPVNWEGHDIRFLKSIQWYKTSHYKLKPSTPLDLMHSYMAFFTKVSIRGADLWIHRPTSFLTNLMPSNIDSSFAMPDLACRVAL